MSYLVLHIDIEFIVGAVCTDDGHVYPITNGKEDLLWLYFFNNPHQNHISFGKQNKRHYNNKEVNYFGDLFKEIEQEQKVFLLRGIEHPIIDLLKESSLIRLIRKTYQEKTLDTVDNIPTLMTFSSSIGDNAKQKAIDYLTKNGFDIKSYTIPISELTCYHALNHKKLKVGNGSMAIFLEATNTTLHLIKLSFHDNYFLKDVQSVSYRGKGLDPRKQALVRFVVNEVNKATGVLSSEDEKEDECERLEMQADEWLKRLDAQNRNIPFRISSVSFSKAPNMKKDVLVRKNDLDSDTGQYTQDLKDIFDTFKSDNVKGDVAAVFLLGNCFQSDRVKSSFESIINHEHLYFYTNKDIHHILPMYPKIDINRYASEEARIKEQAKVQELKHVAQRALEDKQRKAAAEVQKQLNEAQKIEENKKTAQRLYERSEELEKEGKLHDALANVENALQLTPKNPEYQWTVNSLKDKLRELNIKTEQYKSLLNKAKQAMSSNDFESALNVYELAKDIFDSAEIRNTILEVKEKIKNQKQQDENIRILFNSVDVLLSKHQWAEAESELNKIVKLDAKNAVAKEKLKKIEAELQKIERQYKKIVQEANENFNSEQFDAAVILYTDALNIKQNDAYCMGQLTVIPERIALIEENKKRKALKDKFSELNMEATHAEKKGRLVDALALLEQALAINPNETAIKNRIKKIKFDIIFGKTSNATLPNGGKQKKTGFGESKLTTEKTLNESIQEKGDSFLGNTHKIKAGSDSQLTGEDDSFLNPPTKTSIKNEESKEDFFKPEKKKKNDFLNK